MFCINCGCPLNEGEKECGFCGKEIENVGESENEQVDSFEQEQGDANNEEDELHFLGNTLEEQENLSLDEYNSNYSLFEEEDDGLPTNRFDELEGVNNFGNDFNNYDGSENNNEISFDDSESNETYNDFNVNNDGKNQTEDLYTNGFENSVEDKSLYTNGFENSVEDKQLSSGNAFSDFLDDDEIPEFIEKPEIEKIYENVQDEQMFEKDDEVSVDPSVFLSKVVKGSEVNNASSREPLRGGRLDDFAKSFDMKQNRTKIILFIVVGVIAFFMILVRALTMFTSNNAAGLILAEHKSMEEMLNAFVEENTNVVNNEIKINSDKNSSSKFEFSNIDIDAASFSKLGVPNSEHMQGLKNDMRIVWERKMSPKENFVYNDFNMIVRDKEFLRFMGLKQEKNLYIMVPTIYQKKFLIDTSNMQSFYKAVGIKKDLGYFDPPFSEAEFVNNVSVNPSIKNIAAEYNGFLTKVIAEKNVSVDKGVKFAIKDTQYNATKYTVVFNEEVAKPMLKILIAKMNDPEVYKAVVGRYMGIGDVIKQLDLDDGRLKDFGKDKYTAYINSLVPFIDTLTVESAGGSVWVDENDNLLGRNYEFNVKKGDSKAKIGISYTNLKSADSESRVARLLCESSGSVFRNIDIKTEREIKYDQFKEGRAVKSSIDSTIVAFGNPNQKGYFGFEVRSDKNYKSAEESKKTYLVRFDSKEDDVFSIKINAGGTERGAAKSNKFNGEYTVDYEFISKNSYKGKFNVKYDTVHGEQIDASPVTSPVLNQSFQTIELNNMEEKQRGEEYLNIQVAYMKWLQNMDVLLGQKPTSK